MFYGEVDDVIAAAKFASQLAYVDSSRLFVVGHSTGGTLAMLASLTTDIFASAASFGGSPDQTAFLRDWGKLAPFDRSNREEVRLRSPDRFPASLRCPLLLFVGSQDTAYLESTKSFTQICQRLKKPCTLYVVEGDHFTSLRPAIKKSIQLFHDLKSPKTIPMVK